MIRTQLTTALTAAGCTRILYESAQLANIAADQIKSGEVVGIILEPDTITFEPSGNSHREHYPPTMVEIVRQVRVEDLAIHNEAVLENLLTTCKAFINSLVRSGSFQKVGSIPATKITEKRYDAGCIGWALALDIIPVLNEKKC
jgi:hypothetical protein